MPVLEGGTGAWGRGREGAEGLRSSWGAGAIREDFSEELAWKDVRTPSCSDRGPGILAAGDKRRRLCC